MTNYLIKNTTVKERIDLIKQWEEEDGCENSGMDLMDFYADFIDGKREISEINASFRTNYICENPEDEQTQSCGMGRRK